MKKYFLIAKNTCDEMFVYRLNFFMWRFRQVLQLLTIYFLWYAILPPRTSIGTYSQQSMLTYVLGTAIMNSFVFSSKSIGIGEEIIEGNLTNFLIRPINYFYYWISRDIGDKAMNISFAFIELLIIFLFLHPPFFIQTNFFMLVFFVINLIGAMSISFLLNFLLGIVGFWSTDVWGVRFLYSVVIQFFSGGLFPLDLLPKPLYHIFQFLPFSYLLFVPVKIYLGQLSLKEISISLFIVFVWIAVLHRIVMSLWLKGLQEYTATGR